MDGDERDICLYLKSCRDQFVSSREISRRAGGKRRAQYDPDWVVAPLGRLVERGLVEADATGHYKLRKRDPKKKRWLAPHVRAALAKTDKFQDAIRLEEDEEMLS